MKIRKSVYAFAALGAGVALAAPAHAANVVALTGDREIQWVDTNTMAVTGSVNIDETHGMVLGIDVRPADGMLYGVFADGTIGTINPETGAVTPVSTLSTTLPDGVTATVDFNPAADRLRVMGSDGTSFRVNVDTGEVIVDGSHEYADGNSEAMVISGAYTNSFAGTDSTQLFNIDGAQGWLVLQDPPNDGVLNPVGEIGFEAEYVGFDIYSDGMGGNEAWLMKGASLFSVDLESGMAMEVGLIEGASDKIRDIAILPTM